MLLYVAHKFPNYESAKKAIHKLQIADTENVYVSATLMFAAVADCLPEDIFAELRIDMLQMCDKCIVFDESSGGIEKELDFVRLVGMEVEKIGNPERY